MVGATYGGQNGRSQSSPDLWVLAAKTCLRDLFLCINEITFLVDVWSNSAELIYTLPDTSPIYVTDDLWRSLDPASLPSFSLSLSSFKDYPVTF